MSVSTKQAYFHNNIILANFPKYTHTHTVLQNGRAIAFNFFSVFNGAMRK